MNITIPQLKREYMFQVDDENTKNNIFDECRAEGKEAAWAGIGTGQIDSEYIPAPTIDDSYYMEYCSTDDYDYLKDYKLVWGYTIGIVETDVICSLVNGNHLAEGEEACNSYEENHSEGKDTDWKRGKWLKFSGTNNNSPAIISEVNLPDYIISIKDLCINLSKSSAIVVQGFNTNYIVNANNAFYITNLRNCIDFTNKIVFDFDNIKNANYMFAYTNINDNISLINAPDINYNHTFYNSLNLTKIPDGFSNLGGSYCFSGIKELSDISNKYIKLYNNQFAYTNIRIIDKTVHIVCTENVSSAFAGTDIIEFNPDINWSTCNRADKLLYALNNSHIDVTLDFSTLNNNLKCKQLLYINDSDGTCNINIIANDNYYLTGDFTSTSADEDECIFYLRDNYNVNIINTLYFNKVDYTTVGLDNNLIYLFTCYGYNFKIIGNIYAYHLFYFYADHNPTIFLNPETNITLYNDFNVDDTYNKTIKHGIILFNRAGKYLPDIVLNIDVDKFNLDRINFDNCSIICFTYNMSHTAADSVNDKTISINSTKTNIAVAGIMPCNINLNITDNAKVSCLMLSNITFNNRYDLNYTDIKTLNIINDNNANDVNIYIIKDGNQFNADTAFWINTNNTINIINDSPINIKYTDNCFIAIDNAKEINFNIDYNNSNTNFNIYLFNKHCAKINISNVSNFYGIGKYYSHIFIYTFTDINYIVIGNSSKKYSFLEFNRLPIIGYGEDIPLGDHVTCSNFITADGTELDYIYLINQLDDVPYDLFLKNIYLLYNTNITYKLNNAYIKTNTPEITYAKSCNIGIKTLYTRDVGDYFDGSVILKDEPNFNVIYNSKFATNGGVWGLTLNADNSLIYNYVTFYGVMTLINVLNEELTFEAINEKSYFETDKTAPNYCNITINDSCVNIASLKFILNFHIIINVNSIELAKHITDIIIISENNYKIYNNLNLSYLSKLTQDSINNIVNPNLYNQNANLTINTIPFKYITDEQKQALVNAGVTLIEYIPTEEDETI